jgi:hypothetical protein
MSETSPIRTAARRLSRGLWHASGRVGWPVRADVDARATVLVTYYHPSRLRYLDSQVRNLLRCGFVDRLVLSNHNPEFRLTDVLTVRDPRIVVVQQDAPRGCGYRWMVALEHLSEFMIVVDDDLLLYPWQLARVFEQVVRQPRAPHGFAGMLFSPDGAMQYVESEERSVDYLCELYAVTGEQVRRYHALRAQLGPSEDVVASVDSAADFVLISRAGQERPRIHSAGRLFRDETFNQHGVAVHQRGQFGSSVGAVRAAVESLA